MARKRCLDPRIKRRHRHSLTSFVLGHTARHAKRQLRSRRAWIRPRLPSPCTPCTAPNEVQVKMEETPSDNELFVRAEPITEIESLLEFQQCDPKDDDDTASQRIVDAVLFGGFISTDDNDEEASALDTSFSFLEALACPVGLSTQDKEAFDRSQIADQPRILIDWPLSGRKIDILYWSISVNKWWYSWEKENPDKPNVSSHIGRIMETELGVQLFGEKKCTRCQNEGLECWVYSEMGVSRVKFAGTNCTRCRALPVSYGCSHATRRRNRQTALGCATNGLATNGQTTSMITTTYVPILPKNNLEMYIPNAN